MIVLTLRTDKPMAEIGLFEKNTKLAYKTWEAHRHLAETIHIKIKELINSQNLNFENLEGIVCFKGPGSFTGLRIGMSIANALASGLEIPIVASNGEEWIKAGISGFNSGRNEKIALPKYGSPAKVTSPKK